MYIFIQSDDSIHINTENVWSDFTVSLPDPLYLKSGTQWEAAVLETTVDNVGKLPFNKKDMSQQLYLCCDSVESSFANCLQKKILCPFRFKDVIRTVKTYDRPYYMKLVGDRITSLRVYIRDGKGRTPPLATGTTWCALHIRKSI